MLGLGLNLVTAASSGSASGGTWGSITGTLSSQTDLYTELNARATTAGTLGQFAATTSAQLAAVLSDETGFSTGAVAVFSVGPTITTPFFSYVENTTRAFRCLRTSDSVANTQSLAGGGLQVKTNLVIGGSDSTIDDGNPRFWFYSGTSGKILFSPTYVLLASDVPLRWDGGTAISGSPTTGLLPSAAKVVGINDGGTGGGTLSSVPLTPTQITTDQNNYAPGVARYYRLSTDASRTLTGLAVSQVGGQECWILNAGSNPVVLSNQNGSSTAANRFLTNTGADITLAANEVAMLVYDSTTSRWRVWKE